jgi:hypothetical protein
MRTIALKVRDNALHWGLGRRGRAPQAAFGMFGSYELRGDGLPGVLRCAHCKSASAMTRSGSCESFPSFVTLDRRSARWSPTAPLIELISAATTKKGLCIRAERDREWYPTGVKVAHQVDC